MSLACVGDSLPKGASLGILGCLLLERPWSADLIVLGFVLTEPLGQPWLLGKSGHFGETCDWWLIHARPGFDEKRTLHMSPTS